MVMTATSIEVLVPLVAFGLIIGGSVYISVWYYAILQCNGSYSALFLDHTVEYDKNCLATKDIFRQITSHGMNVRDCRVG